jgi:adenosine deaminase
MAKDPWHKGRIGKIKNSPAANMIKKGVNDAVDYLGLRVPPEPTTRQEHFNQGVTEHLEVASDDYDKAANMGTRMAQHGMTIKPVKNDNVSSIMNAFDIRAKKLPPEGY